MRCRVRNLIRTDRERTTPGPPRWFIILFMEIYQRGTLAGYIQVLKSHIYPFWTLGLPSSLSNLIDFRAGRERVWRFLEGQAPLPHPLSFGPNQLIQNCAATLGRSGMWFLFLFLDNGPFHYLLINPNGSPFIPRQPLQLTDFRFIAPHRVSDLFVIIDTLLLLRRTFNDTCKNPMVSRSQYTNLHSLICFSTLLSRYVSLTIIIYERDNQRNACQSK